PGVGFTERDGSQLAAIAADDGEESFGLLLLLLGQRLDPVFEVGLGQVLGIEVRPKRLSRRRTGEERLQIVQRGPGALVDGEVVPEAFSSLLSVDHFRPARGRMLSAGSLVTPPNRADTRGYPDQAGSTGRRPPRWRRLCRER